MHNQETTPVALTYDRESSDPRVIVADGMGVKLTVRAGRLTIADGIGRHRRTRTLDRAQRTVERIVILADTGFPSFDALRWCADNGITVHVHDRDGRTIAEAGALPTPDARITRAQALCGEGKSHQVTGLAITKKLLTGKLSGQADIAQTLLGQPSRAAAIRACATAVNDADTIATARGFEGKAAAEYWAAWTGTVEMEFTGKRAATLPTEWTVFIGRESRIGRSPRRATEPVNALLNYAYRVAESACVTACRAYGIDPGMGISHADKDGRDSFALDLMEAVRPAVDRFVLGMLGYGCDTGREFTAADFTQTRDGTCRVLAPLTHELAERLSGWFTDAAHHAADVRRTLAAVATGDVPAAPRPSGPTGRSLPTAARGPRRTTAPRPTRPASTSKPVRATVATSSPTLPQSGELERASLPTCLSEHAKPTDVLPDDLWATAEPLLPVPVQENRADARADRRAVLAGIVAVHVLGCSPSKLPPTLGTSRRTVQRRYAAWQADGTWARLQPLLDTSQHVQGMLTAV
ncbi:CRISPR-associated endonuclease Cas1 [Streptomyces sp. YGL11-2]|uniref:CRISPR-associated endonuclease Cas1 n=1 Tax=Streptomyces sp. YGL11-2 TaxID=3414028 RepID=UPI003CF37090